MAADCYRFGRFILQPERRLLSADGVPVAISGRALDLLILLVEQRTRVVTKDEIFAVVWQGQIVEENNLAVQVSALRRALGTEPAGGQHIVTVPGRGYRFIATLRDEPAEIPPATDGAVSRRAPWRWLAALGLVMLALAGLGLSLGERSPAGAPRLSIVVLPFRNLGSDPRGDYLADAMSDDVSTDLSHLPGSVVIARESAETFKGRAMRAEAIGQALGVRYLLHGGLVVEGDQLHVNAQLIDAADGRQLWASGFDVGADALGAARSEIVRQLGGALNFTLVQIESARSLHERPGNADALDEYLRARSLLDHDETLPGLTAAQHLLEQAVAAAPRYGDAEALLALVLLRKMGGTDDADIWQDHAAAERAIDAAVASSPRDPMTITARGTLHWLDMQCERAESDFRLALSLDPDDLAARDGLARCLGETGRMQEMIDTLKVVLRIDPASPGNGARETLLGMGLLLLGRPAEALPWLKRARADVSPELAPRLALGWQEWNRLYLIAANEGSGDAEAAMAEYETYARLWPHRTVWQLGSYYDRARSALPGYPPYLDALHKAGMPRFADEHADFAVPARSTASSGGDFDPTPLAIPGGARIDSAALRALLVKAPQTLVIDVGRGDAVIPGAVVAWPAGAWGDPLRMLREAVRRHMPPAGSAIVVMGNGPFDGGAYDAALDVIAQQGGHPVLWYRGGKEAWVAQRSVDEARAR